MRRGVRDECLPQAEVGLTDAYLIRYLSGMERTVEFYRTEGGACPVEKFLRKQTSIEEKKILGAMRLVEQERTLSKTLFKKLVNTDGLWEIRAKTRGNIFRLLCFFDGTQLIVVAHAFQKKTQKTPRPAIQTAETRKRDYFRRKNQ